MTRDELYSILENYAISAEDAQEKLVLIWGQPFDGETEKINTTKSASPTFAIPQTNPAPFASKTDARIAEFKGKMSAISQAHEMWLRESFTDSKTPTQPQ